MSITMEKDAWQIDPVTQRVTPDEALGNPALIVVESGYALSAAVQEVCDFLQIAVYSTQDPRGIPALVPDIRPLAIIQEAEEVDCTVYDLLMVVAGYDPALPVMMVLPENPQNRGALDAARRLWQIDDLTHSPEHPGIRALIEFLFHAGRRIGQGRFMPI